MSGSKASIHAAYRNSLKCSCCADTLNEQKIAKETGEVGMKVCRGNAVRTLKVHLLFCAVLALHFSPIAVGHNNKDTHKPEIPYSHLRHFPTAAAIPPAYDAGHGSTTIPTRFD